MEARLGTVSGVVFARGDSFADALSVAPLAAVKGWPILLIAEKGPLPDATMQALVSSEVVEGLVVGTYVDPGIPGFTLTRIVGSDRYDTSAKIAEYSLTQGLSYAHVAMVTGDNFPDALAAGPFLALDAGHRPPDPVEERARAGLVSALVSGRKKWGGSTSSAWSRRSRARSS